MADQVAQDPVLRNCKTGCGLRHPGPWGKRCKNLTHNGGTLRRLSENVPDRDDSSADEAEDDAPGAGAPQTVNTADSASGSGLRADSDADKGSAGLSLADDDLYKGKVDELIHRIGAADDRETLLFCFCLF